MNKKLFSSLINIQCDINIIYIYIYIYIYIHLLLYVYVCIYSRMSICMSIQRKVKKFTLAHELISIIVIIQLLYSYYRYYTILF